MSAHTRLAQPLIPIGPALALWTVAAPTVLGFDGSRAALANHIAFTMAFAPLTVLAIALRPALVICAVGGGWLALAPWATGYASAGSAAWINDLLIGVLLVAWAALVAGTGTPTPRESAMAPRPTQTIVGLPDQRSAN